MTAITTLVRPGPVIAPDTTSERVGAGRHRALGVTRRTRIIQRLATVLLALAVLVLLAMTMGPRLFGYRTATMLTGSMAPGIIPGDVVVDTKEPATAIAVGQIITYRIPVQDHRVESHRVVWVGRDRDGAVMIRTKGDANSAPDPWVARFDDPEVWRVRMVLPMVGTAIRTLRQPVVRLVLTGFVPIMLLGWLLVSIWRPQRIGADTKR